MTHPFVKYLIVVATIRPNTIMISTFALEDGRMDASFAELTVAMVGAIRRVVALPVTATYPVDLHASAITPVIMIISRADPPNSNQTAHTNLSARQFIKQLWNTWKK